LRDRLPVHGALDLGAQLPTLIRGIYYERWRIVERPALVRSRDEFLGAVLCESGTRSPDAERAARAVFAVLASKISQGEIEDVRHALPARLGDLWPERA